MSGSGRRRHYGVKYNTYTSGGWSGHRGCSGNSGLYERFLNKFLSDPTFGMVTDAFKAGDAQLALTATHTFKGLTANLGLTKLYNISSEMVSLIRDGDYGAAAGTFPDLKAAYDEICGILKKGLL